MKRDFLSMESWGQEQCLALLDLADRVKRGEISGGLEKKIMAMVFMDPSLRTRASFEAAMFLHGGHGIVLEPGKGSWSLETEPGAVMDGTTVEHIKDAARVLGRYADALGVRTFPRPGSWDTVRAGSRDQALRRVLREADHQPGVDAAASVPGPGGRHDAAGEVRRRPRGKRFVLMWAWHPKALPTAVPASAAISAAHAGHGGRHRAAGRL